MEHLVSSLVRALGSALFYHIALLGPIFIYSVILYLIGSRLKQYIMETVGWRGSVVLAVIGTPIHELSHAIAAVIGGHKVAKLDLFSPDRSTGTLGEVHISYNSSSIYQSTFGVVIVAIAPLFGGAIAMALLTKYAIPAMIVKTQPPSFSPVLSGAPLLPWIESVVWWMLNTLVAVKFAPWDKWWFYLYLYSMLSIGAHLVPSPDDMKGTLRPFLALILMSVIIYMIVAVWAGVYGPYSMLLKAGVTMQRLLLFAILINSVALVLFALIKLLYVLFGDKR